MSAKDKSQELLYKPNKVREKPKEQQSVEITAKQHEYFTQPLDKVNSIGRGIWNELKDDTHGQLVFSMERMGDPELNLYFSIDFDSLPANTRISKHLTPYDRRIYNAVGALYTAGNNVVTPTMIFHAIGYPQDKRPAQKQIEKIIASVTKMMKATITIDNTEESSRYNYEAFKYIGQLLQAEQVQAIVNGKITQAAIRLLDLPPLVRFATTRKQITTFPRKLIENNELSKTDANIAIEDYLIERIAQAKHGLSNKILYETIVNICHLDRYKKAELPETVDKCLKHFIKCDKNFLKKYDKDETGVTVYF